MKLKITAALIALTAVSHGAAVTLSSFAFTYNPADDYGVVLSNGNPVAPEAGLASVIVFTTLTDTQVSDLAAAQDYATLFAPGNFTTLASDNFTTFSGAGYGQVAGFFDMGASGINPTLLLNETLYAYFSSGSELGLFKTNSTLVADSPPPATETTYPLSLASGTALIGSFGTYNVPVYGPGGTTDQTANSFQLVAIPEPSAAFLGALGALGLLRRRRI